MVREFFVRFKKASFAKDFNSVCEAWYYGDTKFDGVANSSSYHINSAVAISYTFCSAECLKRKDPICVGFLYNAKRTSCKLLKTFLTENDKITLNVIGEDWEYLSVKVENLALGKAVSVSTIYPYPPYSNPSYAVDGQIGLTDIGLLFITDFELYPWLSIALGQLSIVKNVILYNRRDLHGHWLHSVEIRGGISSVWSEMKICGTFAGPSQTGQIHTIECKVRPLLYGSYVTVKIVRPNYITNETNAIGGKNILVLEEVVVNGLYAI